MGSLDLVRQRHASSLYVYGMHPLPPTCRVEDSIGMSVQLYCDAMGAKHRHYHSTLDCRIKKRSSIKEDNRVLPMSTKTTLQHSGMSTKRSSVKLIDGKLPEAR